MSADHTRYIPPADATDRDRGSYGGGLARAVMFVFLIAALGFFLPFAWIVDIGIFHAAASPTPGIEGGTDAGGVGWVLQDVVGVAILGLALAAGMAWNARRDRAKDPVTEAATAALYDHPGESARSPEARPRDEREGLTVPDYRDE